MFLCYTATYSYRDDQLYNELPLVQWTIPGAPTHDMIPKVLPLNINRKSEHALKDFRAAFLYSHTGDHCLLCDTHEPATVLHRILLCKNALHMKKLCSLNAKTMFLPSLEDNYTKIKLMVGLISSEDTVKDDSFLENVGFFLSDLPPQ